MKKVCPKCHGCKRFQAMAKATLPPGCLPTTHSEGINPFQVIGVNYAGPLQHRISRQGERKAYVLLYACSVMWGVYLDILPSLETEECLRSLKKFIGRQGRPEQIYSGNGRTFVGAVKWVREW